MGNIRMRKWDGERCAWVTVYQIKIRDKNIAVIRTACHGIDTMCKKETGEHIKMKDKIKELRESGRGLVGHNDFGV